MLLVYLASLTLSALVFLPNEEKRFVSWMREHNLVYTGDEYLFRFGIFITNSRFIQEHNNKNNYKLKLNQFAAYTTAEYKVLLGFIDDNSVKEQGIKLDITPPETLDWREKGAVTEVGSQGNCGSCWAFSAIAAEEGAYFVSTGKLLKLSEQNLVDCASSCHGCVGGSMVNAFFYVKIWQNGHFNAESDYPYKEAQCECKFDPSKIYGLVKNTIPVQIGFEDDLAAKCATYGPCCVTIDASRTTFTLYSSGVYDDVACSKVSLNHAVTLVGYGIEDKTSYWILKNSWGKSWGEEGYMRLIKDGSNRCGITEKALVPLTK